MASDPCSEYGEWLATPGPCVRYLSPTVTWNLEFPHLSNAVGHRILLLYLGFLLSISTVPSLLWPPVFRVAVLLGSPPSGSLSSDPACPQSYFSKHTPTLLPAFPWLPTTYRTKSRGVSKTY